MGCNTSSTGAAHVGYGVLVRSAKNLRKADTISESDPYVVVRFGPQGTLWEKKGPAFEKRSATAWDTANPSWQFAFSVDIPRSEEVAGTWELHLRVYDKDLISGDDSLGELVVPLRDLKKHEDSFKDYPLEGPKAAKGSTVEIIAGERVEKQLLEELKEAMESEKNKHTSPNTYKVLEQLCSYWDASPTYAMNLVAMHTAWTTPINAGQDPGAEWFDRKTTDATGKNTYRWNGPEYENSMMLTGHADIVLKLTELGSRLGTNNTNGLSFKPGWLGVNKENPAAWPEVPWHTIGLGAPQEVHAKVRPLLTKLTGPAGRWSMEWLNEQARSFFNGRASIDVHKDTRVWTTQVLHQVLTGITLTDQEGADFMDMQKRVLIFAGMPEVLGNNLVVQALLESKKTMEQKKQWLSRYKDALLNHAPECKKMSVAELTAFTSNVMDALLFAGGQSVPTVLQFALSLPYSKYGEDCLPKDFHLCDNSKLPSYVWEIVRRFPPVGCFVVTERSLGSAPDQRVYLNLSMGQRDQRTWGPNAGDFVLRPVSDYHRLSVGFAEPALAPGLADPNARACPAKDLALAMVLAFMQAFVATIQDCCHDHTSNMHKEVWVAQNIQADKDGVYPPIQPSDIEVNADETTNFRLWKKVDGPSNVPRTGAQELQNLTPKEIDAMTQIAKRASKFDRVNCHTKFIIKWVQTIVTHTDWPASAVGLPQNRKFTDDDFWVAPIPGLRMIQKNDIDESFDLGKSLKEFTNSVGLSVLDMWTGLPFNETLRELVYFDSPAESFLAMNVTFGNVLPPQYQTWTDLDSDHGTAELCITGVGQWYLAGAKTAHQAGHEVPAGAVFECDLSFMQKYETRQPWIGYGHTAYLGEMPKEGCAKLLGIWECHSKKMVRPGDAAWEAAKAGFRCSVCTAITLKEHLGMSHLIYGNSLMTAARVCLGADHPLRRLLRQFYLNTAVINFNAKEILFPVNHFGFRVFGFTEKGWTSLFTDLFESYSWKSFPETVDQRNLPEDFQKTWTLREDGTTLFNCFNDYVRKYLDIFYADDAAVTKDEQVKAFWAHFDKYLKWKLPPLTKANLNKLLADVMWWVTAGHHFHGAIVEYLTCVNGLCPKLAPGKDHADAQTFAQQLSLIALTGFRMPKLMDDWTHMFKCASWDAKKQQVALAIVRGFQADLEKCADVMDERNVLRNRRGQHAFVSCNPRTLESSVAI